MLTRSDIRELIADSPFLLGELMEVYGRIPVTQCARKTHCCTLLPEATLVEVLAVIECLKNMSAALRKKLYTKLVGYFFLNPVDITSCPFLKGKDCLIYPHRFFGCRAYGLWSYTYYENLAGQNRRSKALLQEQWKRLGIALPKQVVEFEVPYCKEVETRTHFQMDDRTLTDIWDAVKVLSGRFSRWYRIFQQSYFGDMSFLFASLTFGFNKAVQMKYNVVREIVVFKNRDAFEQVMATLSDFDI